MLPAVQLPDYAISREISYMLGTQPPRWTEGMKIQSCGSEKIRSGEVGTGLLGYRVHVAEIQVAEVLCSSQCGMSHQCEKSLFPPLHLSPYLLHPSKAKCREWREMKKVGPAEATSMTAGGVGKVRQTWEVGDSMRGKMNLQKAGDGGR